MARRSDVRDRSNGRDRARRDLLGLRNRMLRAVRERNDELVQSALDKLTPRELLDLADDGVTMTLIISDYLGRRPDLQSPPDRIERRHTR